MAERNIASPRPACNEATPVSTILCRICSGFRIPCLSLRRWMFRVGYWVFVFAPGSLPFPSAFGCSVLAIGCSSPFVVPGDGPRAHSSAPLRSAFPFGVGCSVLAIGCSSSFRVPCLSFHQFICSSVHRFIGSCLSCLSSVFFPSGTCIARAARIK